MSAVQGYYFDGRYALRRRVGVLMAGDRLKVVGTDVDGAFDARQVRVSPRIANTPRWLYLPDGGVCVVGDNDFVDRLTRESALERTLHKWESRPAYAALAVALVALGLWLMIDRGLPIVVDRVAEQIPVSAETALGEQTLAGMDRYVLKASEIAPERQRTLRAKFDQMAQVGGPIAPPRLEFRSSPAIGPNAFALPSGIIVITDELVMLADNDREVLAVLAHELGHVRHRHTMRQLLRSSATALIIAGVTGDIASTTSIAAAAPMLLLQGKYSRDYEREADQYALDLLQRSNIAPRYFASILQRMEESAPAHGSIPSFLSSHPATEERKALALKAAGDHTEADDAQDAEEQ